MSERTISVIESGSTAILQNGRVTQIHSPDQQTVISKTNRGPTGAIDETLEARVDVLEENTDGLLNDVDLVGYYLLAKGT